MMRFTCALIVCLCLPAAAAAQAGAPAEPQETNPHVRFDHLKSEVQIFDLDLEDGESFVVRISNTCPDAFDYPYIPLPRAAAGIPESKTLKPLQTHDITVVYDARYGGYIFNIVQKPGMSAVTLCQRGADLVPASFVVSVREKKWGLSFSGGFTFSGLTSPVYGIETNGETKRIVDETAEKGDERKLGVASFVHAFHDKVKVGRLQPSLAFGLGINGDNRSEYFVGAGLRLGDLATINLGRAYGSISRLPNGVDISRPVTDDNILSNLGSKVVGRYFFAVTFSFIDTRDHLKKPFASDAGAPQSAAAPAAGGAEESDADPLELLRNIAANAELYEGIPAMQGITVCRVDVAADDKKAATVTLHVKEAAALESLSVTAVVTAVTDAVKAAIPPQSGVSLKAPVAFGASCTN